MAWLLSDIQAPTQPKAKLLIVTYMRSGSTFTGDMFDQSPDAFYVFEPLHGINDYNTVKDLGSLMLWNKEKM